MWIIGHRGAAGTHPENTLAGIEAAIDAGADWVEIDIRLVDSHLVVLHDERLERTTDGTGSVYDRSLAELQALDAGSGERIPLLGEVLECIDARCCLNIEIKQDGLTAELIALLKQALVAQPRWQDKLLLSSFLRGPVLELSQQLPDGIKLAALSENSRASTLRFARDIGAYSLNIALSELDRQIVDDAHRQGLRLFVYTVNDTEHLARCRELGVDGVFTDYPGRAIAFLHGRPII